jgi:hypothetical protein
MYSNSFVVTICGCGNYADELSNGEVLLQFNTEYGIYLKNKNYRRAVAKIFIDGENVSGGGYIIPANQSITIYRHADIDKAFRFVSLTSKAAKAAGKSGPNPDKEKGLVEVRFYLEKERLYHLQIVRQDRYPYIKKEEQPWIEPYPKPYKLPEIWCSSSDGIISSQNCSYNVTNTTKFNDGCTVDGGQTGQSFTSSYCDTEETYTSIKLFLRGYNKKDKRFEGVSASKEVRYCPNCGAKPNKTDNFCSICGKRL